MAARSSLLRRIAALAPLAPRLVRLAHHDYPDRLLARRLHQARARRGDRQRDAEGAPGTGPALDLDPPAMSGHHRVAHREPEPRPAAYVLGGEERVEDAAEDIGREIGRASGRERG